MNQADIIKMAAAAGFETSRSTGLAFCNGAVISKVLTRFAALVREATLEEAAMVCEDLEAQANTMHDVLNIKHADAIRALKEKA